MPRCSEVLTLLLGTLSLVAANAATYSAVCTPASGDPHCTVSSGRVASADAWCTYVQAVNTTGWAEIEVWTDASSTVGAYAAGFLEGYLTQDLTWAFRHNFFSGNSLNTTYSAAGSSATDKAAAFLEANFAWVQSQIAAHAAIDNSAYWQQINLEYTQLAGMVAGYNSAAPAGQELTHTDFLFMNSQGDIGDIQQAVLPDCMRDHPLNMSFADAVQHELAHTHCSVLLKWTGNMEDLYAGHTMWWSYYAMLRVYKTYHMGGFTVMFSSYPGLLSSTDDIYQTSTGLIVLETTNNVYNSTLYDLVKPEGAVLSWARVVATNRLATSGAAWVSMFAEYNSGTYNNMWMVVDTKLFTPGVPLPNGTLTILEQLPGYTQAADLTHILRYGYFPSYNRAYFAQTRALSGEAQMIMQHGNYFTYSGNPRANIMRRSQGNVTNVESYKRFIRSNNWQTDPLAQGSAGNQIAARFDLIVKTPPYENQRSAGGAIDAKVTSASYVKAMQMDIISGPTAETQPAWTWTPGWGAGCAHMLQPVTFDFDWIQVAATAGPAPNELRGYVAQA